MRVVGPYERCVIVLADASKTALIVSAVESLPGYLAFAASSLEDVEAIARSVSVEAVVLQRLHDDIDVASLSTRLRSLPGSQWATLVLLDGPVLEDLPRQVRALDVWPNDAHRLRSELGRILGHVTDSTPVA